MVKCSKFKCESEVNILKKDGTPCKLCYECMRAWKYLTYINRLEKIRQKTKDKIDDDDLAEISTVVEGEMEQFKFI